MSLVNALIAVKESVHQLVKNKIAEIHSAKAVGQELTPAQKDIVKLMRHFERIDIDLYRHPTIDGDKWRLYDVLSEPEVVAKFDEIVPTSQVAGCWNPDGTQYGQSRTWGGDDWIVTGSPVYPIHPKLLDFMPDDVEYNANGTEKSRKRPAALKQVHKWLGWADRRWT